jgi:hypothetical protein
MQHLIMVLPAAIFEGSVVQMIMDALDGRSQALMSPRCDLKPGLHLVRRQKA